MSDHKCVLVIDEALPRGVIANTAAVLALSLGGAGAARVGAALPDHAGTLHRGISTAPIPILRGQRDQLCTLRATLAAQAPALIVVDLISATQHTKSYADYACALQHTPVDQLHYLGLGLYGPRKAVDRFTGSLGLLR